MGLLIRADWNLCWLFLLLDMKDLCIYTWQAQTLFECAQNDTSEGPTRSRPNAVLMSAIISAYSSSRPVPSSVALARQQEDSRPLAGLSLPASLGRRGGDRVPGCIRATDVLPALPGVTLERPVAACPLAPAGSHFNLPRERERARDPGRNAACRMGSPMWISLLVILYLL